jgi:TRAP-type uncharacterized transport system fused permease subunit
MRIAFTHGGMVRLAAAAIGVAMALYHMWIIVTGTPEAIIFRGTHLLFALVLTFLIFRRATGKVDPLPAETGSAVIEDPPTLFDYACLVLAAAPIVYLFVNYDYVVNRIYYVDDLTWTDMILGTVLVVMIMEATRRLIGWALPITAIVFLAYGLLYARVEPMRLLDQLFMTTRASSGCRSASRRPT